MSRQGPWGSPRPCPQCVARHSRGTPSKSWACACSKPTSCSTHPTASHSHTILRLSQKNACPCSESRRNQQHRGSRRSRRGAGKTAQMCHKSTPEVTPPPPAPNLSLHTHTRVMPLSCPILRRHTSCRILHTAPGGASSWLYSK